MMQHLRQDGPRKLDEMARRLATSGDFKVLRRLVPRPVSEPPADVAYKTGIVLEVETTGLDFTKDETIELAMVKVRYARDGAITGVSDIFQGFSQPSIPIPAEITKLTGITDAMVAGQTIDGLAVETFVADADIFIAHHAGFDRKFAEPAWPIFAQKPWACSANEIDWKHYDFSGAKLSYLAMEAGFFYDAHRASTTATPCWSFWRSLCRGLRKRRWLFCSNARAATRLRGLTARLHRAHLTSMPPMTIYAAPKVARAAFLLRPPDAFLLRR